MNSTAVNPLVFAQPDQRYDGKTGVQHAFRREQWPVPETQQSRQNCAGHHRGNPERGQTERSQNCGQHDGRTMNGETGVDLDATNDASPFDAGQDRRTGDETCKRERAKVEQSSRDQGHDDARRDADGHIASARARRCYGRTGDFGRVRVHAGLRPSIAA
jgi:hypothetical protein